MEAILKIMEFPPRFSPAGSVFNPAAWHAAIQDIVIEFESADK